MRDKARKIPGNGRIMGMRAKGLRRPVFIRLGTSDLWVFQEIFLDGEYDAVKNAGLANVKTVVDLGSNIGLSIRYWRMLYPSAKIVGVEPDAENMLVCERNAKAAEGPETTLVQACVAGSRRKVALDRSAPAWAFKIQDAPAGPAAASSDEIDALTMPEILERAGMTGDIDLLKCDIEGAEAEVLADCAAWIPRVRTLIIELHTPYMQEHLMRDLERNGFKAGRVTSLKRDTNVHVLLIERAKP